MSYWEIAAGIALIISCIFVIGIVLSQDAKGQGLSSVITGTSMMSEESRSRSKEARQVRITRVAGIIFFVLAVAVNVISAFVK
ncbi:MAG: preprotein translocase subunit SecG [Oscillospiraceae bacterium]